ncbi:MAG: hypothetical protein SCALA702_18340 [Melioribacteraceae bacterium]|nr:MAG: hypothetical protein SCALA702_18340 [Melioribacteraceae bacterium]
MHNKIAGIFLLLLFLSGSLISQSVYDFLRLDASPKAAALAGSYVAGTEDPDVIYYNPAAINTLEGTPVSFSYLNHLLDINAANISASHVFEDWGRFGAALQYINYGEFTKADEYGNRLGEFSAYDMVLILGYANEIDKNFNYGVNFKVIQSAISDQSSSAVAADIGVNYLIPESKWVFGFSALNIGSQISSYLDAKEDLPLDIRIGFSKELAHMPFKFYFSINHLNEDADQFLDRFKQFTVGGEFRLSKVIKLRFGYDNEKRKELKIGTTAGLAGFNIGLGVKVSDYFVDYAFSSLGSIGAFHRIGIATSF